MTPRHFEKSLPDVGTKRCRRCRKSLLLEAFSRDASKPDGRQSHCKTCDREYGRAYYVRTRERQAAEYAERQSRKPPRLCAWCESPTQKRTDVYCPDCREVAAERRVQRRYRRNLTPAELERAKARERARVRVRASARERGYGPKHVATRNRWKGSVEAGLVDCARCGKRILPGEPWDLGHDDRDRSRHSGPEHRRCNRATASHRAKAAA